MGGLPILGTLPSERGAFGMIDPTDYFNQVAEKKGEETTEFYDGPATDASMLSDITATDYDGVSYFTNIWFIISGGVSPSGIITVTGKDRYGNPQSEDVTVNANHEFGTVSDFWSEITSITSAGLSTETPVPNVAIKIWNQSSEYITFFGWTEFDCRWEENPVIKPSGSGWDYGDGKVFTQAPIEISDVLKYEGIEFTVLDMRVHRDLDGKEQYRTVIY